MLWFFFLYKKFDFELKGFVNKRLNDLKIFCTVCKSLLSDSDSTYVMWSWRSTLTPLINRRHLWTYQMFRSVLLHQHLYPERSAIHHLLRRLFAALAWLAAVRYIMYGYSKSKTRRRRAGLCMSVSHKLVRPCHDTLTHVQLQTLSLPEIDVTLSRWNLAYLTLKTFPSHYLLLSGINFHMWS